MKLKLSTEEMLSQWRMRRALEPLRSDCMVERIDGIDIDSFLKMEMRDWYLNLLDTAPLHLISTSDVKAHVSLSFNDDLSATIILPPKCRRVVEIFIDCSNKPVTIIPADSPLAMCQQNPFSRSGAVAPVAILHHDRITIYAGSNNFNISRMMCVMEPDDGFYELDEAALSLISKLP